MACNWDTPTVYILEKSWYDKPYCRCSSSVEHQLPKLRRRVRFPSSALVFLEAEVCKIKASTDFLKVKKGTRGTEEMRRMVLLIEGDFY